MTKARLAEPETPMSSRSPESIVGVRLTRQRHLVVALRLFGQMGLNLGLGGHMTVRDPERPQMFWVNPRSADFRAMRVRDLILVDERGTTVEGSGSVSGAGFIIHSYIHSARPDLIAAVHTHSRYGQAWSSLGRLLDPITQESCAFYQDHGLLDGYSGIISDEATGREIVRTLADMKALILKNHGLLTVGSSIDEAAMWFIRMEQFCEMQLLAEAAGTPQLIAHDVAKATHDKLGKPANALGEFERLYESTVSGDEAMLD
jgi:ribulose-5-phosphate 4-epimerase/fuculose-1-phosphate aldolase